MRAGCAAAGHRGRGRSSAVVRQGRHARSTGHRRAGREAIRSGKALPACGSPSGRGLPAEDDTGQRLIDRAIARLPIDPPHAGAALAMAWDALLIASSNPEAPGRTAATRRAREAIELARACGAGRAEAHALITIGTCICDGRRPGRPRSDPRGAASGSFAGLCFGGRPGLRHAGGLPGLVRPPRRRSRAGTGGDRFLRGHRNPSGVRRDDRAQSDSIAATARTLAGRRGAHRDPARRVRRPALGALHPGRLVGPDPGPPGPPGRSGRDGRR